MIKSGAELVAALGAWVTIAAWGIGAVVFWPIVFLFDVPWRATIAPALIIYAPLGFMFWIGSMFDRLDERLLARWNHDRNRLEEIQKRLAALERHDGR